jgi:hypothetical protein
MKKSMLYIGIGYILAGLAFLLLALLGPETRLTALFWGLGGAGFGPGLVMFYQYIHFSNPKHASEYEQLVKTEKIEAHDERRVMLQDKSGRICYLIFLYASAALCFLFTVLLLLDITVSTQHLVFLFAGLLLAQFLCNTLIYHQLDKRL